MMRWQSVLIALSRLSFANTLPSLEISGTDIFQECCGPIKIHHESTEENPSFLQFGIDCRIPTEAAYLPSSSVHPVDVKDYERN